MPLVARGAAPPHPRACASGLATMQNLPCCSAHTDSRYRLILSRHHQAGRKPARSYYRHKLLPTVPRSHNNGGENGKGKRGPSVADNCSNKSIVQSHFDYGCVVGRQVDAGLLPHQMPYPATREEDGRACAYDDDISNSSRIDEMAQKYGHHKSTHRQVQHEECTDAVAASALQCLGRPEVHPEACIFLLAHAALEQVSAHLSRSMPHEIKQAALVDAPHSPSASARANQPFFAGCGEANPANCLGGRRCLRVQACHGRLPCLHVDRSCCISRRRCRCSRSKRNPAIPPLHELRKHLRKVLVLEIRAPTRLR
mmetsp:Transcript_77083/g.249526  ORF Transcript_77083/g.249526 Transcript_77083/m.249526 type:complete len:312 (+) Transcript_77083:57-992(+)